MLNKETLETRALTAIDVLLDGFNMQELSVAEKLEYALGSAEEILYMVRLLQAELAPDEEEETE